MRIAVGGYLVSANSFATQRTGLERFQRSRLSGEDLLTRLGRGDNAIAGFLRGAREHSWEAVPLHYFFPGLAGKITDEAHQWAKEAIVEVLRKAHPIDGVFLQLHGTAASDSIADCDGDLLQAIRGVVGDGVPVIASLDGHANVSELMVRQASMLIGVKTNPHYDFEAVGRQAAAVMAGMFDHEISPAAAWAQPRAGSAAAKAVYRAGMADGPSDAPGAHPCGGRRARPGCIAAGRVLRLGSA